MRRLFVSGSICLLSLLPTLALAVEPTGDALYDRYSELALTELRPINLAASYLPNYNPAVLPDEVLSRLEPEFGSDARYWELRAWSVRARRNAEYPAEADTPIEPTQLDLLRKARDCSNVSIAVLYRLATLESRGRMRELDAAQVDPAVNWPELREQLIQINRQDEDLLAADLDAIIARYPDEAWPYYWKADYWLMYGEQERGTTLLEQGNAAARCSYPALFPESFIRQRLWAGQSLGEKALAGGVFAQSEQLFGSGIRWKEHGKELALGLRIGGGRGAANAFQRFACRVGSSDGLLLGDSLVALVLANMLGGGVLSDSAEDLSQEQILVLLRARDKHNEARTEMTRYSAAVDAQNGSLPYLSTDPSNSAGWSGDEPFSVTSVLAVLRLSADSLLPKQQYEGLADEMLMQQQLIREKIRPVMTDLALVDFNTLAWPEAWGQPE